MTDGASGGQPEGGAVYRPLVRRWKGTAHARRSGSACSTFLLGQDPTSYRVFSTRCCSVKSSPGRAGHHHGVECHKPGQHWTAGAEAMLLMMRAKPEYALKRALAKFPPTGSTWSSSTVRRRWGKLTLNGWMAADELYRAGRARWRNWVSYVSGDGRRCPADHQLAAGVVGGALPTLYDSRTTHNS